MHFPGRPFFPGFGSRGDVFGFGRMDLMSGPYGPAALSKVGDFVGWMDIMIQIS
jgi:hypothetical protein